VVRDLHRLDEHSDADFFVIVDDIETRNPYIADVGWLKAAQPVVWSFPDSPHGRKALLEEGLFAEYAVFTPQRPGHGGLPAGACPLEPRRCAGRPRGADHPSAGPVLADQMRWARPSPTSTSACTATCAGSVCRPSTGSRLTSCPS